MGLDITVYKIITKDPTQEWTLDDHCFDLVDDDFNYSNPFPEWTKQFEADRIREYYDWKKFGEKQGIDINDYNFVGTDYTDEGPVFMMRLKNDRQILKTFNYNDVPVNPKTIKVLPIKEVGYQRKGLNDKFYEDYENGIIGYFVWTKAELERYLDLYCDEPHEYIYPNGEPAGFIIKPKEDFKKNIIDNFVEGEDCVTFDW